MNPPYTQRNDADEQESHNEQLNSDYQHQNDVETQADDAQNPSGSDFDSDWSDSESTKEAFEREILRLKVSYDSLTLNLFFRQRNREQNEVITISSDENAGSDNLFDVRVLFILLILTFYFLVRSRRLIQCPDPRAA